MGSIPKDRLLSLFCSGFYVPRLEDIEHLDNLLNSGVIEVDYSEETPLVSSSNIEFRDYSKHLRDNMGTVVVASYLLGQYRERNRLKGYEVIPEAQYLGWRLDLALAKGLWWKEEYIVVVGIEVGDVQVEKVISCLTSGGSLKELWHFPYSHKGYFYWKRGDEGNG